MCCSPVSDSDPPRPAFYPAVRRFRPSESSSAAGPRLRRRAPLMPRPGQALHIHSMVLGLPALGPGIGRIRVRLAAQAPSSTTAANAPGSLAPGPPPVSPLLLPVAGSEPCSTASSERKGGPGRRRAPSAPEACHRVCHHLVYWRRCRPPAGRACGPSHQLRKSPLKARRAPPCVPWM
jgi:hypothetical protein